MKKHAETLANYMRSGYVLLCVMSYEEDRALAAVKDAGAKLGRTITAWSESSGFGDHQGPGPADPGEALTRIAAVNEARIFVLHDFHNALENPLVVRRLRELMPVMEKKNQAAVITSPSARVPVELEKEMIVVDLPVPGPSEMEAILDRAVKESGQKGSIATDPALRESAVRAAMGLTAREARRTYARVLNEKPDFTVEDVRRILDEKKQSLRRSELLEFYDTQENLASVGGLDLLKDWIQKRSEAFGARARKYGLPPPKGMLLLGVQGCGKSLSAKAVSGLWGIPLIRLDLAAILNREGEGDHLRRAVTMAENLAPCVLWVDEIEKGFSIHRVSGAEARGNIARAFATFLTWLQEKTNSVYVMATANSISEMPPELLRKGRFDDIFFVDLPRDEERKEIFSIHLIKRGRDPKNFDLDSMAKLSEGFSGSEIEQAVVSGMYAAFTEEREVETNDIERSIKETVPLSETMEERIKELRDWAKDRARPASLDTKLMDLLSRKKQ